MVNAGAYGFIAGIGGADGKTVPAVVVGVGFRKRGVGVRGAGFPDNSFKTLTSAVNFAFDAAISWKAAVNLFISADEAGPACGSSGFCVQDVVLD